MDNVNSLVKLEKVSYERVMKMKDRMVLRKNGVEVLVIGLGNCKRTDYESDWIEVERKNGVIRSRKEKWSWWNGKVCYCLVSEDEKSYGLKWLKNVVESKFGTQCDMDFMEEPIEEDENFKNLERLVDEGNVEAMFHLANFYFVPDGPVKQDITKARELYERVCLEFRDKEKSKHYLDYYLNMSRTQLGFIYSQGLEVEQDMKKAFYHFRWGARHGIGQAMYNLGLMYLTDGEVWNRDLEESEHWLRMATKAGVQQADWFLNRLVKGVQSGSLPEQDPTLADARIENDIFIWQVVSVQSDESGTRVVKCCTPKVNGTMIWSIRNESLIDSVIGMQYCICDSELPFSSRDAVILKDKTPFYFTEIYPPLQYATETLDIDNGNGEYYIRNWKVKK